MKLILPLILVLILAVNGCVAGLRLVKQDELVKIYERVSLLPHGRGDQILEFKGKRYHHLVGRYVLVPGRNTILFATSRDGERKTLHVLPISEGKEFEIDLGDTGFGSGIGLPREDPASNYIEHVEDDKITFAAQGGIVPGVVRFVVDLKVRTFVQLATPAKELKK